MARKLNKAGIDLVKTSEGCRLDAYQDAIGVWTIGYGHTGSSVKPGQKISQHEADVILASDLEKFAEGVDELTSKVGLTDNQFAACVSFAFNVGVTRFASSTLYKKLCRGDAAGAAEEFLKWTLAGGQRLAGLEKRREAERALFLRA